VLPYVVDASDQVITITAGTGAVTLPALLVAPLQVDRDILILNLGTGTATITPAGANTIAGAATYLLGPSSWIRLIGRSTGDWTAFTGQQFGDANTTERFDYIPRPEGQLAGDATQAGALTLQGAAYRLDRAVAFDRIIVRNTAVVGGGTLRFMLYQTPDGGSGVANRVATVTAFPGVAASNLTLTPTEGEVTVKSGIVYALWGRDGGTSITLSTYTNQATNLLTQNVDINTHPTVFSTALLSSTTPATFNPRQTPTGQATGVNTDLGPIFRLRHT
jgi:hypothetical protein